MGTITTVDTNFLSEFISDYLRNHKPLPGGTQKEAARQAALWTGFRDGMAHGLAYYANELRREKVRSLSVEQLPEEIKAHWVPMIDSYEVSRWLQDIDNRWDKDEWKEVSDEAFYAQINAEFLSFVFNEEWQGYYQRVRKDSIMAGLIDPDESDREWIEQELKAYSDILAPVQKLKERLDGPIHLAEEGKD